MSLPNLRWSRYGLALFVLIGLAGCGEGDDLVRTYSGHTDYVCEISIHPKGTLIASGGADGTIRFWDTSTGECLRVTEGHKGWVQSVAFGPDGRRLASAGRDNLIKLWDAQTGELLETFAGHTEIVRSVAYSPDGRRLASCGNDKSIRIWEIESGECLKTLDTDDFFSSSMVLFGQNANELIIAGDTAQFWDIDANQRLRVFEGHSDSVGAIATSQNGCWLATAGSYEDTTLRLWDTKSGACLWRKDFPPNGGARALAFMPNGGLLASGHTGGEINLWDAESGAHRHRIKAHVEAVSTLAAHPDGKHFVSGGWDNRLKHWNLPEDVTGDSTARQGGG